MYDIKDIGKRITTYRKYMDMTQEELAVRLNITAQAVSKWEKGVSLPDIAVLPELAAAFNTSMDKLFGNEGDASITNIDQLKRPRFPDYISSTLRLVHTFKNVGCYSEKEVSVTNEDTVIFTDASSANLKSLKVINKGPGDICFDFNDSIPSYDIDTTITELHETFEEISSVKLDISAGEFSLVRSADNKTNVDVTGSPFFIAKLKISGEKELLTVGCKNENNSSGGMHHMNKVSIAFGRDAGECIKASINGEGSCDIKVPFKDGNISINGSGNVTFEDINDAECKINGCGEIKCNKAGNIKVTINGAGDFEAQETRESMKSVINGAGDIRAGQGEIDSFEAKICGSGDIKAENICTRVANISIDGSGDITIGRVIEESVEKHSKSGSIKVLKRG